MIRPTVTLIRHTDVGSFPESSFLENSDHRRSGAVQKRARSHHKIQAICGIAVDLFSVEFVVIRKSHQVRKTFRFTTRVVRRKMLVLEARLEFPIQWFLITAPKENLAS